MRGFALGFRISWWQTAFPVAGARMNLDTLFAEALARPEPDREPYLLAECPDEAARRQVLRLLAAHARAGEFLAHLPDTPHGAADTRPQAGETDDPMPELPGGRYRVTGVLGRGGMGIVYRAEQSEPVRRPVAIKVVRPEAAAGFLLARFEAERQTLAGMNHPNVAAVYDGGTTADGRPYFVMELVDGVPITQFRADRRLQFAGKLALFLTVCSAVQHAHQRGILHRDLKPSNVLVAEAEGKAVAKVIDFGVAKAADARPDQTGHTRPGTLIGTPEYMSPEQADLTARDIDVRADVYSLAVLLYELVTGDTPIRRQRVREAALLDILQAVRTEEPPPAGAKARGLPVELDWILAKGLHKDRDYRYLSVAALADDLTRMTRNEAVTAAPTGGWYRVRKFVRRNWLAAGAAAAVFASLVGGTVGTTIGMVRAQDAERVAEGRRVEAEANEARAVTAEGVAKQREGEAHRAKGTANRERDTAQAMLHFFTDDVLARGSVKEQELSRMPLDPDIRLSAVIDAVAPTVRTRFAGRPEIEQRVQLMIGDYYARSLQPAKAKPHLDRAAELLQRADHLSDADRAESHYWLGVGYGGCDDFKRAHHHFTRGIEAAANRPTDPMTFALEHGRVIAALRFDPPGPLLADLDNLIERATPALGDTHHLVHEMRLAKGVALHKQKRHADAVAVLTPLLETVRKQNSAVFTPEVCLTLGKVHYTSGNRKAAEGLLAEAIDAMKKLGDRDAEEMINARCLLADCRKRRNDLAGAIKVFTECRDWCRADPARHNGRFALILTELASCHLGLGHYPAAADAFAEAVGVQEKLDPAPTPAAVETRYFAARAYHIAGRPTEAVAMIGPAVEGFRTLKIDGNTYLLALELYACVLCESKEFQRAETVAAECVERCGKIDPKSELYHRGRSVLGAALAGQGKYADAEPVLLDAVRGLQGPRKSVKLGPADVHAVRAVGRLIDLYERWEKPDAAAQWKEKLPPPMQK